jgi:hypothetical protein
MQHSWRSCSRSFTQVRYLTCCIGVGYAESVPATKQTLACACWRRDGCSTQQALPCCDYGLAKSPASAQPPFTHCHSQVLCSHDSLALSITGGYDSELEGALAAGHVGAPLQPGDKALLRLRPLRHYEAGELVALKRRLAATSVPGQAAAAAAEARATAGPSGAAAAAAGGGDDGGTVLCYGRVAVDAAPQPGQAAYRLSVEVAPGVYESVLSTQVCGRGGVLMQCMRWGASLLKGGPMQGINITIGCLDGAWVGMQQAWAISPRALCTPVQEKFAWWVLLAGVAKLVTEQLGQIATGPVCIVTHSHNCQTYTLRHAQRCCTCICMCRCSVSRVALSLLRPLLQQMQDQLGL